MYSQSDIEKISREEKRLKRKLTGEELEDALGRELSRRERLEYRDNITYPIIEDEPTKNEHRPPQKRITKPIRKTIKRIEKKINKKSRKPIKKSETVEEYNLDEFFSGINVRNQPDYNITRTAALDGNVININYELRSNDAEQSVRYEISNEAVNFVRVHGIIKLIITIYVDSRNPNTFETFTHPFRLRARTLSVNDIDNMDEIIANYYNELISEYQNTTTDHSGLVFLRISRVSVNMATTEPNAASSYIELPKYITDKKATINVKNNDNECFNYAVLAGIHYKEIKYHKDKQCTYTKYKNELNFKDIEFPVAIEKIPKFEHQNPNIAINVYMENNGLFSLKYKTIKYNERLEIDENIKLVNLLYYIQRDVDNNGKIYIENSHYVTITNLNRLTDKQCNKNKKKYYKQCPLCLNKIYTKQRYNIHVHFCNNLKASIEMPNDDNKYLHFINYNRAIKHNIAIYIDTEAILKRVDNKRTHHILSSIGFRLVVKEGIKLNTKIIDIYRGKDCLEKFFTDLEIIASEYIKASQKYPFPDKKTLEYKQAKKLDICHICNKNITDKYDKVVDHDHATGKILGAAHKICNEKRVNNRYIPIYAHNMSGYDTHFIIKKLYKLGKGKIKAIPKTDENYISFSKLIYVNNQQKPVELRFLDSYRMMPSSLDTLAENLYSAKGIDGFPKTTEVMTKEEFKKIIWNKIDNKTTVETIEDENGKVTINKKEIKTEKTKIKGVFPYSYVDSWEKYEEKNELTKEAFFDDLNNRQIPNEDYIQYKNIYKYYNDLGMYSDLYLITDILILADVMEAFRNTCLENYNLDPVFYYTAPGLFWDAMLKKTGVELELITDYNMMQYFEKGIRGGVSTVLGDRHVKIDDPKKERLMYLDANNLYGWAMNQKLPTGNFEWIDKEEEIEKLEDSIKNDKINGEEDIGYCMRVDLIVPKTEKYINYPLAPENKNIEYNDLSEYSKSLLPGEKSPESEKLILDFTDKKDYMIHIKNLIEYYKLGAKFTIKDAIKFEQSPWLKPYIDFNTEKRSNANNEFEKDFYKLANNSVFGKTMENVRNYQEIHLCNSWKNAKYFIKKPNFNNFTIFDKNLVAIHMDKTKITFNKPIYVGFAILEISKTLMYDFYYNKLEKIFNNVKAVYTDTDSFVIYIKDDNITKKLKENEQYFDFSNYPKEHILYSEKK